MFKIKTCLCVNFTVNVLKFERRRCLQDRPCAIYQYSNIAPRLSGQTSIFGFIFFVSKSLGGIERQKKLKKMYNFDPKTSEPC